MIKYENPINPKSLGINEPTEFCGHRVSSPKFINRGFKANGLHHTRRNVKDSDTLSMAGRIIRSPLLCDVASRSRLLVSWRNSEGALSSNNARMCPPAAIATRVLYPHPITVPSLFNAKLKPKPAATDTAPLRPGGALITRARR